jgi:predicted TIM-barrel fold metal-dependent hydrolase
MVVDCLVRATADSDADVARHLPDGWLEYFAAHVPRDWQAHLQGRGARPERPLRGSPIDVVQEYRNPLGDTRGGHDLDAVRAHLDAGGIDLALLYPEDRLVQAAGVPTVNVAVAAARAINEWLFSEWVERDARLRGVPVVATQVPELAAAEIRHWAGHAQAGAVAVAAGGLAKPFGHPVFGPIHAAAEECGLPIVLLAGTDAVVDSGAYPVAGGFPGTYAELRTLAHQSLQSHAASLLALGVVRRYPGLRFLALGGGLLWVAPWLWRLDVNHQAFRYDVAWLEGERPSDAFKRHFAVGTGPFVHAAEPDALLRHLRAEVDLGTAVVFASGFPDWAATPPAEVLAQLPPSWTDVAGANAERLLNLAAVR